MHIAKKIIAGLMSLALLLPGSLPMAASLPQNYATPSVAQELRGLWVASVYNIDYPMKPTTDAAVLKNEALDILNKAQDAGLNAVFLQVRPTADAFYPSAYFPWSKYLTGTQGTSPSEGFDPLAFWVDEAHKRSIELHAWINPYRITKKGTNEANHNYNALTPNHPARLHPEWTVKHTDGNLYFNPGIPEVRQLIVDSSLELVQNYAIDGIHFDDYFYPGQAFADEATFKIYGTSFSSIHDWRRDNVNQLVAMVNKALKSSGREVAFGISPFGIWANKSSNALGSDTKGLESYYEHYADTRKWVLEGTVDYIAPQIYWHIGFNIADYSKLLSWWQNIVKGTNVKLYVGHAAYRVGNTDTQSPWYGVEEIQRQLNLNQQTGGVDGDIYYNFTALKKIPALVTLLSNHYRNKDSGEPVVAQAPTQGITFARPSGDIKTRLSTYFIVGTSDPALPLTVNGSQVAGRSSKGYFGYYAQLQNGVNTFVFDQGGVGRTLTITKDTSVTQAAPMSTIEIPSASVFPQAFEMRVPGEVITLSCKAPIGSTVTVKIGGKSYPMKPAVAKSSSTKAYATTYTYSYTMPSFTGSPRRVPLGKPVYTMTYKGQTKTRTAPGDVEVILPGTPYYAKVTEAVADTYKTATTANGAATELYSGMLDRVTGVTGAYARLDSGLWLKKEVATLFNGKDVITGRVESVNYLSGSKWDSVVFNMNYSPVAIPSFDGKTLILELSGVTEGQAVNLPAESLFESATWSVTGTKGIYTFVLKNDVNVDGYGITPMANGLSLDVKRRPTIATFGLPLSGISILLDPGHGGADPGALGPLGASYAEKHINFGLAKKLETVLKIMGATVEMTRQDDSSVSLNNRLAMSRQMRPDLFISIHANSVDDSANINEIYGFSIYYKEPIATKLSDQILRDTVTLLGRKDRGAHVKNFYVTRGTWAPSVLLETGFVPNPIEFEWLADDLSQMQLATEIARSVVTYFSH